jgi:proline dehydrogenase
MMLTRSVVRKVALRRSLMDQHQPLSFWKNHRALLSSTTSSNSNPVPDFNDAQLAYARKSVSELTRAVGCLSLCRVRPLVYVARPLLKTSRRIVGDRITDKALELTLFGHFCAGVDEEDMQPTIRRLEEAGIGSILDFAAEGDDDDDDDASSTSSVTSSTGTPGHEIAMDNEMAMDIVQDEEYAPKVRVYNYDTEAQCDRHVDTFKKCINDVAKLSSDGFAAVKVTALGNPLLLEKMSRGIFEAQQLFRKFDRNGNGFISRDEFEQAYKLYFKDEYTLLKDMMQEDLLFRNADSGDVDYISWSMLLSPKDLPRITDGCRVVGPLKEATPDDEEVELIEKMFARGHALGREAAACGTRLLIDAEQARFQPAIDNLVLDMQRKYNAVERSDKPIVYNTYQCYLKDVPDRLRIDVQRSERFSYHFGAKLVRGAYMESEREFAKEMGVPSPVHESIQDTHECYNNAVEFLLEYSASHSETKVGVELMLATHNQESIEKAIDNMNKYGIDRRDATVSFGQLYGMADNLTYGLGLHGYRAYKYVPYGEIKMVMPYLIRRANENSSLAGGAARELRMIGTELKRRLLG